jgi:hypothetical protein
MAGAMEDIICRFLGHEPELGRLQRSPNTPHTHLRYSKCSRCGMDLGYQREYHDAVTEPELFGDISNLISR